MDSLNSLHIKLWNIGELKERSLFNLSLIIAYAIKMLSYYGTHLQPKAPAMGLPPEQ